jgi:hypothetical protein
MDSPYLPTQPLHQKELGMSCPYPFTHVYMHIRELSVDHLQVPEIVVHKVDRLVSYDRHDHMADRHVSRCQAPRDMYSGGSCVPSCEFPVIAVP